MHIAEGVLSPEVIVATSALTVGAVALGLRRMEPEDVVRTGILSAGFFVASLVHVPLGPVSVHMLLHGLAGVILGWAVFPALLVALLLQALFFGYGGLTTLGANTLCMAGSAVACHYLFGWVLRRRMGAVGFVAGFGAGAFAVALSGLLVAFCLLATGREFTVAAGSLLAAHVPVMLVEGVITGTVVVFLHQVRPEIFRLRVGGYAGEHA